MSRLDEPIPYEVSDKGRVKLDDLGRVCETCGAVGFKTGYVYGDDYYCEEHEPENFRRDFKEQQRRWDEEQEWPEFNCYWTEWENEYDY